MSARKPVTPILEYLTDERIERFWSRVWKGPDCWLWRGYRTKYGYGEIQFDGRKFFAHRIALTLHLDDDLDPDLVIDHLCRNSLCVNPEHLEEVSCRDNNLRGISPAGRNATKRQCPYGHEYPPFAEPRKRCRACYRERKQRIRQAAKALGITQTRYLETYGWSRAAYERALSVAYRDEPA